MSNRITKFELDIAFEAYVQAIELHDIPLVGKPTLVHGSKVDGRAYRLFLVDSKGGQSPFPGVMGNGYLGMTRKEAYDALWLATNVARDVYYMADRVG